MAAPIQMRYWLREFGLEDLRAGMQPIRQAMPNGELKLFAQPALEFRYREKINGELAWSEWNPVLYAREGDDAPAEAPKP